MDGGFGRIAQLKNPAKVLSNIKAIKEFVKQEIDYIKKGPEVSRDRKTILLDLHEAYKKEKLKNHYDFSISSNVIEHSPNPIYLLLNFYFITKPGGYQYHAIPHYEYTYDCHRKPTSIAHIIKDFEEKIDESDLSHTIDYYQLLRKQLLDSFHH